MHNVLKLKNIYFERFQVNYEYFSLNLLVCNMHIENKKTFFYGVCEKNAFCCTGGGEGGLWTLRNHKVFILLTPSLSGSSTNHLFFVSFSLLYIWFFHWLKERTMRSYQPIWSVDPLTTIKHAYTHKHIYSFIHSFIHSLMHAFIQTFIYSYIHSIIHSFIHTPYNNKHESMIKSLN